MIFVIDEAISFAEEAFSRLGEVRLYPGREISNKLLKGAGALIIRSVTNVNEELLRGTGISFVGTATIGTDHVDTALLNRLGIKFSGAAGCNADAVTEYLFTSIFHLLVKYNISLKGLSIGIIGCGNIGSRAARISKAAGLTVVLNDPPLERMDKTGRFSPLEEALKCDIVTLHVPLNAGGTDNTIHLIGEREIELMKEGAIFINAARGPVADNAALLKGIKNKNLKAVLDVWENEPRLNPALLAAAELGTPHIAGYSYEGKVNGTKIIFDELNRHLNTKAEWTPSLPPAGSPLIRVPELPGTEEKISYVLKQAYAIEEDDSRTRLMIDMNTSERAAYFDALRKEYPLRREFNNYTVEYAGPDTALNDILKALRFNILKP